jgi:hypothetical protein
VSILRCLTYFVQLHGSRGSALVKSFVRLLPPMFAPAPEGQASHSNLTGKLSG